MPAHPAAERSGTLRSDPQSLDGKRFDLLVVGGGIHGVALAREAALRSRSVLLCEKGDFGWATSSHSSRLIHGGLRYLEQGHLGLVYEALAERERLLRCAPHLCRPLPMLMPFFSDSGRAPWLLRLGLRLYDLLAWGSSLPGPRYLSRDDCLRQFPGLRSAGLRGGSLFYDARTEDQRLCQAVAEAAVAAGAQLCNHLELVGQRDGAVCLHDRLGGAEIGVRAGQILNAAGPRIDAVRRRLSVEGEDLVRLSRGSHVLLPPRSGETALAAFLPDRRIQFVIPHEGGTICGTTEVEEGPAQGEHLGVPEADVEYLLAALAHLLDAAPGREDLLFGYAGWRALPRGDGPAGRQNREAFLVDEQSPAGPVHSVLGGKLTTHRAFAERCIKQLFGLRGPSPTRDAFLPGGDKPQDFADPLWWRHGSQCLALRQECRRAPDLAEPLCPHRPFLVVELRHALQQQAAMTLADALQRRLFHSLGPCVEAECLARALELYGRFRAPGSAAADASQVEALLQARRAGLGALARD